MNTCPEPHQLGEAPSSILLPLGPRGTSSVGCGVSGMYPDRPFSKCGSDMTQSKYLGSWVCTKDGILLVISLCHLLFYP